MRKRRMRDDEKPSAALFPPKEKPRNRGAGRVTVAFRCPEHLLEYIKTAEAGGYIRAEVLVTLLEFSKEISEGAAVLMPKVRDAARMTGRSVEAILVEMLFAGSRSAEMRKYFPMDSSELPPASKRSSKKL